MVSGLVSDAIVDDGDGHEDVFEDVVKEDDNDEPLETSCVSLKSGWSTDSCPRRSMRMMAMVKRMFLRMLLRRMIMMNL